MKIDTTEIPIQASDTTVRLVINENMDRVWVHVGGICVLEVEGATNVEIDKPDGACENYRAAP